jgi:plasmid stabilization system protein ParE
MAFQVEFTHEATRNIESIFEGIHADAPLNAARWRQGLEKKLHLLTFMADSFGLAK